MLGNRSNPDRRDPKTQPAPPVPDQRRMDDRRESGRVPMRFLVRDFAEGGSYQEREGDLALGGIFFSGKYPAQGSQLEVRFRLPGVDKELRLRGEIVRASDRPSGVDFHVRFLELEVGTELAIARYIDQPGQPR